MSERKVIRLISPEPVLPQIMERIRREYVKTPEKILPEEVYQWMKAWAEDIGTVMRSRENATYTIAMILMSGLVGAPFVLSPGLKERRPLIARALGAR